MRPFIVLIGLLLLAFVSEAQPGPNIPPDPPSAAVPISGLEWLLLSGGILGAQRIFKRFKDRTKT